MKRILFVASLIVASAIAMPVSAKKKKEKNQQAPVEAVAVEEPVILASSADTLSYIAGKTATNGLIPFIQQQYRRNFWQHHFTLWCFLFLQQLC